MWTWRKSCKSSRKEQKIERGGGAVAVCVLYMCVSQDMLCAVSSTSQHLTKFNPKTTKRNQRHRDTHRLEYRHNVWENSFSPFSCTRLAPSSLTISTVCMPVHTYSFPSLEGELQALDAGAVLGCTCVAVLGALPELSFSSVQAVPMARTTRPDSPSKSKHCK